MRPRVPKSTRKYVWAASGQALAFVATLIPIFGGQTLGVVSYVLCAGVASLFANAVLMSIPLRLPGLGDGAVARRALRVSGVISVVVVAISALAFLSLQVLTSTDHIVDEPYLYLVGILITLGAQCVAASVNSWCIRWHRERELGFYRASYGAASVVLAGLFLLVGNTFWPVILASSLAILVASVTTVLMARITIARVMRFLAQIRLTDFRAAARGGLILGLTTIVNGIGAQSGNLIVAILPPQVALPWATIMRVGGGGLSVGGAVLAPFADVEFSRAWLRSQPQMLARALARSQLAGLALGLVSPAIGVYLAFLFADLAELPRSSATALVIVSTTLLLAQIGISVSAHFVTILGDLRWQSGWFFSRGAAMIVCLAVLEWPSVAWLSAAIIAFASIAYVGRSWQLVRRANRRHASSDHSS